MKNLSIFVTSTPNSLFEHKTVIAIFVAVLLAILIANIGGYQIPSSYDTCVIIEFGDLGEAIAFLVSIYFSFSFMPNSMKNASRANSSSRNCTQTEGNTVSMSILLDEINEKFIIEKYAKNMAYHFIISHGLLNDYVEFSRAVKSENNHKCCIQELSKKI